MAEGKGSLKLGFKLIPKEDEVKEGDIVLTAALGGSFPKGILVGEIEKVRKSDAEPFQEGEIKPYFTKADLKLVFIITNFKNYQGN